MWFHFECDDIDDSGTKQNIIIDYIYASTFFSPHLRPWWIQDDLFEQVFCQCWDYYRGAAFFSMLFIFSSIFSICFVFIALLRQQYEILSHFALSHDSAIWFIQMSSCLTDWRMVRRVFTFIFSMMNSKIIFQQNSQFQMRIIWLLI